MKKTTLFILTVVLLLTAVGCTSKPTEEASTTPAVTQTEKVKLVLAEKDVSPFLSQFKKLHVLEGTKNFKPIEKIMADKNVIKGLLIDDSFVDYTKAGTYKIRYTVVINEDAYLKAIQKVIKPAFEKTSELKTINRQKDIFVEFDNQLIVVASNDVAKLTDVVYTTTGKANDVKEPTVEQLNETAKKEIAEIAPTIQPTINKPVVENSASTSPVTNKPTVDTEHTHNWITETINHPAEYKTVRHDAEYKTVRHDAEYKTVNHPAEYKTEYVDEYVTIIHVYTEDGVDFGAEHGEAGKIAQYGLNVPLCDYTALSEYQAKHNVDNGTEPVSHKVATHEVKTLIKEAYDEQVLVKAAYDEQVLVKAAYDEKILVKDAYTETITKCSICGATK